MDVTRTAFGSWNGGRFMHFGMKLDEERWVAMVRRAWNAGIRTFVTADVYGGGAGRRIAREGAE
jgi:aryl-alcohol dehydrogenase-like predicted oxidoreductase